MKKIKQQSHWSVTPYIDGGYIIKNQYDEVIREKTSNGLYDYVILSRMEDTAEVIANHLNSGLLTVNTSDHNTIKELK